MRPVTEFLRHQSNTTVSDEVGDMRDAFEGQRKSEVGVIRAHVQASYTVGNCQ